MLSLTVLASAECESGGQIVSAEFHSTICNDCKIGSFVSIMSGASVSERAEVGNECFLAAGSCVYPHKRLGSRVEVGVEATASRDYADGAEVNEKSSGFSLFK